MENGAQVVSIFDKRMFFLNAVLLEMDRVVIFWNSFSHAGHTLSPINCLHMDNIYLVKYIYQCYIDL